MEVEEEKEDIEEAMEEVEALAEEVALAMMMAMGEAVRSATSAIDLVTSHVSARRSKIVATGATVWATSPVIVPKARMSHLATTAIVLGTLLEIAQKARRRSASHVEKVVTSAVTAQEVMTVIAVEDRL